MTVDISADGDWGADWLDVGLFEEDFFGFFAEVAKVFFVEAFCFKKVGYALVDVHCFSNLLKYDSIIG